MILRELLLVLPIHKRNQEQYYKDYEKHVQRVKTVIEKQWGKFFDQLERDVQIQWESLWY